MRSFILSISVLLSINSRANDSTGYYIKINFLYGSRPVKEHKKAELKYFGGIKGGHVNIEAGGRVLDFMPGNNPLFPENRKPSGGFRLNRSVYWDIRSDKWTTIFVPVSGSQFIYVQKLFDSLSSKTPYDYAILGMRCASASYDVLSQIGLFKEMSNGKNILLHFYPKLLRKKVLKWAEKNHFIILKNEGRSTRKWEKDKGLF